MQINLISKDTSAEQEHGLSFLLR